MITSIRRFLEKNSKEGLGFVILLSFVIGGLVGLPALFQKKPHEMWVIRVNNKEIAYKDFLREVMSYQELIASLKSKYGQLAHYLLASMGLSSNPQQIATEKLIQQTIIDEIDNQIGIVIAKEYVDQKIHDKEFMKNFISERAFNANGSLNMDIVRRELGNYGISVAEFEQSLFNGITRDFTLKVLQSATPIAQFDLAYQYQMQHATRDIMIVEIPFKEFLDKEKENKITDAETLEYFTRHNRLSRRYWSVENRSGTLFKTEKSSYPVLVSDEEIVHYYEKNKTKKYIKSPAQVVVEEIRGVKVQKMAPIDEKLWKKVEPFARGTHDPIYERAAFGLKNPGDISDVITLSDDSSVLLRLVKHIKREYKSLDEVRDEIKTELVDQKFKKQFLSEINDLIKKGEINTFIKSKGVKKSKINVVIKEDKNIGVSELFSLAKIGDMKPFINKDSGYVVSLTAIEPAAEQSFDTVKDTVLNDMYAERAHLAMEHKLKTLNNSISSVPNFAQWIKMHNAKVLFEGMINTTEEANIKTIEKYGLSLEILSQMDKAPTALLLDQNNGRFIYVKSITQGQTIEPQDEKTAEKEAILKERTMQGSNAIVASFYRNAKIEINELIIGIEPEEQA